jgi:DNA polymerase-3 subunit delta
LLDGEDGPLKDEALAGLLGTLLSPEAKDLDLEMVEGPEAGADQILSRVETAPFLSPCRVVVVRGADRLSSPDKERIVDHLKSRPAPHACLILLTQRIDRRGSFFRSLQSIGKVISHRMEEAGIEDWLKQKARERGKTLAPEALKAILESMGKEPNLLAGELEKLILSIGERSRIEIEDVLAQGRERMHHIFEVVEALGYGKMEKVLAGIRILLDHGEEPLHILGMVARHLRLIAKAMEMKATGISQAEIGKSLKIPPSYLRSILSHGSSLSRGSLEQGFRDLLQTDLILKSGGSWSHIALELPIFKLGQPRPAASNPQVAGREAKPERLVGPESVP